VGATVGVEVGSSGGLGVGVAVGSRVRVAVGVEVGRGSMGQAQPLRIWAHRNRLKARRFIAFLLYPILSDKAKSVVLAPLSPWEAFGRAE